MTLHPTLIRPVSAPGVIGLGAWFLVVVLALPVAAQSGGRAGEREGGQEAGAPVNAVAGTVRDALTGAPVPGATVVLLPESSGAFPGPPVGSAFATATRASATDSEGAYVFGGLPPGMYRLYASAVGYRPYSALVELRGSGTAGVSLALDAEPLDLHPIRARGHGRGPYQAAYAFGEYGELARLMAAEQRRRHYLTTDVRELTHSDVVEAVTLGEPDVFRALQRLPGVTTRSDYTAELWTRGAPWSHTRVYFDGVPLFNPLHALGVLSGIPSSSLGAAWFHPGVRSAGFGQGAAGVVDLQSRSASGAGDMNVQADLSLMTAGLTLDQRVLDARAGWTLTGRRTYLDWLSRLAERATGREDADYPYGFSEVSGRVDAWVGGSTLVEASWLWEGDELRGDDLQGTDPLLAEWGNAVGRITLVGRTGGLLVRNTLGTSRHRGWAGAQDRSVIPADSHTRRLSESRVEYAGLTGSVGPEPASLAGTEWNIGYALQRHTVGYYGPHALPVPRSASWVGTDGLSTGFRGESPLWWNQTLWTAALWGERSWSRRDRLSVRTGLRLETGGDVLNSGPVRAAPTVSVRLTPIPEVSFSAGAGRTYQYTQALAPGGVHLASLISTDAWLLAGPGVPALRSDMATLGVETWLAPTRIATINTFARRTTGMAVPDPRPGPLFERPLFVDGVNVAYGVEVSARQLAGRVTGTVSYAMTRSSMTAAGLTFPSSAERPHVLDATALVRAAPSLRVGAGFTAATGVVFTRVVASQEDCSLEPGCDPDRLPWAGHPHDRRAPTYASLDLLVDWSTRVSGVEVGIYGQLRNVLGRENGTIYTGDGPGTLDNLYEQGLPRLPVVGVRVRR